MKTKLTLCVVLLTLALAGFTSLQKTSVTRDPRPNVILVVSDDMRWDLMSVKDHPHLETPNLDALANSGALIEHAFVPMALCSPSRASLLTGKDVHKASAPEIAWINHSFIETQTSVAEYLKQAGYKTAYFGKWHLGKGSEAKRGFDHWASFDWLGDFYNPKIWVNGEEKEYQGFVDDVLAEQMASFIREQQSSGQPFFAVVGLKQPHLGFDHPKRHASALRDTVIAKPDSYEEDFAESGKLSSIKQWLGINEFVGGIEKFGDWDNFIKSHYRAIMGLNDAVGVINQALEDTAQKHNTLLIYTSDNGYTLGEHGLTEKHLTYEEPIRVPMLLQYPDKIRAKIVTNELVSTKDLAPTILDYAEVELPADLSGSSIRPILEGSDQADGWRDELFFFITGHQVALRTQKYKLIQSLTAIKHFELYDLEADPKETRSLYGLPEYAAVQRDMQQRLKRKIDSNGWTARKLYALHSVYVSQPVPTTQKAQILSELSTQDIDFSSPSMVGGATLDWQKLDAEHDHFDLTAGASVKPDESVIVVLPMTRKTPWDPFVDIILHPATKAEMYFNGEQLWSNAEPAKKPGNLLNPPLINGTQHFAMSFAGDGRLSTRFLVRAAQDTLALPAEDGRLLGRRVGRFKAVDGWQPHANVEIGKRGQELLVQPSNELASIITDHLNIAPGAVLNLRVRSEQDVAVQVRWQQGSHTWLGEAQSEAQQQIKLRKDNGYHATLNLANSEPLTSLRIDFLEHSSPIGIQYISLESSDGRVDYQWPYKPQPR